MLRLENIKKDYRLSSETVHALKGISLAFRKNEFVSILGPSGCGKTTILNIIGGLDKYTFGDLFISGKSTKEFKSKDWDVYRNHRVGFVFQSYNLIPHQTVLGNVELALTISGVSQEERAKKAMATLDRVGLSGMYNKKPNQLSGGQCQRVAIARALVNDPEILLADEPTGALDTATSVQIMELIKEISGERLVIMVTHNPELAQQYSTRIVRLLDGEVIEDSNPFAIQDEIAECDKTKEQQQSTGKKQKKEKAKMSMFTALKLSAKNLLSKKGRTAMIGVAGSIGIIGIAMVLAISSGIKLYISSMQDDMLSGNPITITETTYDMDTLSRMMSNSQKEEVVKQNGKVYIDSLVSYLAETNDTMDNLIVQNNITDDYIKYVENMPKSYYSAMTEDYGLDLSNNIYTDFAEEKGSDSKSLSVSAIKTIYSSILGETSLSDYTSYIDQLTNSFELAPNSSDYIKSQYDIVGGKIAEKKNEVMLVLDSDSQLSDLLLAQLGYYNQDQFVDIVYKATKDDKYEKSLYKEYFTYDELLNRTFTLYGNDDVFTSTDNQYMPFTYNANEKDIDSKEGMKIRVVGILQPKEDLSYGCLSSGVYYTSELNDYILAQNKDSEIVNYLNDNDTDSITSMNYQGADSGITYKYSYSFEGKKHKNITGYVGTISNEMSSMMSMGGSMGGNKADAVAGMGAMSSVSEESSQDSSTSTSLGKTNMYSLSIANLGGKDVASAISIFPVNFEEKDNVTAYLDKWNDDGSVKVDGEKIKASQRDDITYTDTLSLIISLINTMVDIISYGLIAFTSISLVVSTVMIGIITYVSVVERIKEIGVIRSLGGRKKDVSHLFNAETFIIGLLSGLIGIAVTYLMSFGINVVVSNLIGIDTIAALPVNQAIILVVLSVVLTLISGLIPAKSAAKKDPVEALRTE